jgi:hypothetical protein
VSGRNVANHLFVLCGPKPVTKGVFLRLKGLVFVLWRGICVLEKEKKD